MIGPEAAVSGDLSIPADGGVATTNGRIRSGCGGPCQQCQSTTTVNNGLSAVRCATARGLRLHVHTYREGRCCVVYSIQSHSIQPSVNNWIVHASKFDHFPFDCGKLRQKSTRFCLRIPDNFKFGDACADLHGFYAANAVVASKSPAATVTVLIAPCACKTRVQPVQKGISATAGSLSKKRPTAY